MASASTASATSSDGFGLGGILDRRRRRPRRSPPRPRWPRRRPRPRSPRRPRARLPPRRRSRSRRPRRPPRPRPRPRPRRPSRGQSASTASAASATAGRLVGRLGVGELRPHLGERGGQGRVDPALRLGQRVRRRVAALRALPALTPLAALARGGRRCDTRLRHRPDRGFLGLLEAEAQAVTLGVEADDLELEDLALVHDVARVGHALVRQLADVDQALEALADPDEGAEVDELRDRAVDDVADIEVRDGRLPRIGLEAADRQADPAALVVDVDDLGLDLVTDLVAGLGVVDLVPR